MNNVQQSKIDNKPKEKPQSTSPPATPLAASEQTPLLPASTPRSSRLMTWLIIVIAIAVAIGIGFWLWNYSQTLSSQKSQSTYAKTLRIESEYWPGVYWVAVANSKGWFKEAGLNVKLVDATTNYDQTLQDMVDGKMEENNFTLFDLMRFNAQGADLVGVVNTDVSSGTEGIMTKTMYNSLTDLKGKRIGTEKDNYLAYLLEQVLKSYGMTTNDVTVVNIDPDAAADELNNGTIDAALTWEPFMGQALEKYPQYHKIFDTSKILGANPSVIAFHKTFIDAHPDVVQNFVNVWNKTTNFMQQNPTAMIQIILDTYGKSASATKAEAESYAKIDKILNLKDNKTAFTYAPGLTSLYGAASQINRYMLDQKTLATDLDATKFLNPTFVRAVKE